jgi:pimeloyl-ACP methyl ester carboxylesterase
MSDARYVDVGTARLWVEACGAGAPVVLVHDAGVDRRMWTPQVEALSRDHRVIVYDQRGHGHSSTSGAEPYVPVADLAALVGELGLDRVVVVGLASGAARALELAVADPSRVAGVVLACPDVPGLSPAGFDADATADEAAERLASVLACLERMRTGEVDAAALVDALLDDPAFPDASHPQARALVRRMLHDNAAVYLDPPTEVATQPPVADQLADVRCHVLVLARDGARGLERAAPDALVAGIPRARLVEIDASSLFMNLECPRAFEAAVRELLADVAGA